MDAAPEAPSEAAPPVVTHSHHFDGAGTGLVEVPRAAREKLSQPARREHILRQMAPDVRNRLADAIQEQADEIRAAWTLALRETASPLYSTLPAGELESSMRVLFDGYLDYLRSGQPDLLGGLVSAVARVRFAQGFPVSDLEDSVGAMNSSMLPTVVRIFANDPEALSRAIAAIMVTGELASVRIAQTYDDVTSAELRAAQEEALRAEQEKVAFCREMARVATHEKLILCDHEDVPEQEGVETMLIATPREVRDARHAAARVSEAANWDQDHSYALQLCIGEAGTNAIRHAGSARFQVWAEGNTVHFRLADQGPGIDFCRIPTALRSGFSTGSSLGMGFTLMLELADQVHLATDHRGTTVQLTIHG